MAETHKWVGKSGKSYTYQVCSIGTAMKDEKANYIYAKKGLYGSWLPVYIGQGNLKDRSDTDSHHKGDCIKRNGATHFHAHLNAHESNRTAEETDLIDKWDPTCNG